MINPHPIYVAYLQYGAGHYDAVVAIEDSGVSLIRAPTSTDVQEKTCNCGRKSDHQQCCVFSLSQYSCRCPCYNSKQSCKAKCRCKNCSNPFRVREKPVPKVGSKHKRTLHENQKFSLQGKKTRTFMEAVGDLAFLISSTVHWLAVVEWETIETQDVHTIYTAIV